MAIQDSIPITTLERAVSTDIVNAEALINRSLVETLRVLTNTAEVGSDSAWTRDHVQSGLRISITGGAVYLEPGLLAQDVASNPPDVPAPDTFDSAYRFGVKLTQEALTDPWDASDKWWLLQARVVRVTTLSEKRDIYNPTLGTFALSGTDLDKRYESRIEWAWKAGTSTVIPDPDAGYARIGAVYRPSGGGAIGSSSVVQLGVQFDDLQTNHHSDLGAVKRTCMRLRAADGYGDESADCRFNFAAEVRGQKLFARASSAITLRDAAFIDSNDIASIGVDGLWWYIYLCAPTDMIPDNLYGNDVEHKGCIILSRTPPNDYGANSGALGAPNPINKTIPGSAAAFVGVLRAAGAGTFFEYIDIANNGRARVQGIGLLSTMNVANSFQAGVHNFAVLGASGTELIPFGCHAEIHIKTNDLDTGPSTAVSVRSQWELPNDTGTPDPDILLSCRNHMFRKFWIHPRDGAMTVTITSTALAANMVASGGGISDAGNNEYDPSLIGVRLI